MLRDSYLHIIQENLDEHPVVAILGPRQCGKTTLARMYTQQIANKRIPVHFFDLEDPLTLERFQYPKLTLDELVGIVVIDEIQYLPDFFPYLRVLADRPNNSTKFIILGSASRDLIRQTSETLAGRVAYMELTPFTLKEVNDWSQLWVRGGFPRSYLATSDAASMRWRQNYIMTFLERDIPSFGINIPPQALRRFWMMLAHYHGNILNASELARSLDITAPTVKRYLDILTGVFMIRQLHPWFVNISKRQVKMPKIYFRDSGLLHTLTGIGNKSELLNNPKLGSSWEGVAIEEIIRAHHATVEECYFWATHANAELDLLIVKDGKKLGFEIKYSDVPRFTKSMRCALEDLQLDSLTVIFPGKSNFLLAANVKAIGLEAYLLTV